MKYAENERFALFHGDNRAILPTLPENSVDAIVTDPPYELGFMGKSWDASGVAFDSAMWREALRVLKPGGHLLAFSGSRTYHRMAVAIEDAGFEIRDQIMWIYGSGFPKSLDISKALDKSEGVWRGRAGKVTSDNGSMSGGNYERTPKEPPYTEQAKQWQGWGTALKPAHEPIVVARKPLIGTVAANVLTYGTGGLNIEASRVASDDGFEKAWDKPVSTNISADGGKYISEGAQHTVDLGNYKPSGRWPANVIHDGSDEVVELFPDSKGGAFPAKRGQAVNTAFASGQETEGGFRAMGDDGSAARFFYCAKANKRDRNEGLDGFEIRRRAGLVGADRDGQLDDVSERWRTEPSANHHPTVKPTDLMRYLCRLVTPPQGIILDPFMGSGSTGKGAIFEGFNFIGIEMTEEYLPIAKARIEFAISDENQKLL